MATAAELAEQEREAKLARAQRRLDESESGAKALRQRVADEVASAQSHALELRRTSRDEATRLVADARAEADHLRQQARTILESARQEVASLLERRKSITSELGHLSGVIDALAVGERRTADDTQELATEGFKPEDEAAESDTDVARMEQRDADSDEPVEHPDEHDHQHDDEQDDEHAQPDPAAEMTRNS
jgi:hypothetical protein